MERAPRLSEETARDQLLQKLQYMHSWFLNEHIEYRLLGSLGLATYLDPQLAEMKMVRTGAYHISQRYPDIDILVQKSDLPKVKGLKQQLLQDPAFPLSLELVPSIRTIDFRSDEEYSYLTDADLRVPVPTRLFERRVRQLAGIEVWTVDPRTLFHMYSLLGRQLREKDRHAAFSIGRTIRDESISDLAENDYTDVHTFLHLRRSRDPHFSIKRCARNRLLKYTPKIVENAILYHVKKAIEQ